MRWQPQPPRAGNRRHSCSTAGTGVMCVRTSDIAVGAFKCMCDCGTDGTARTPMAAVVAAGRGSRTPCGRRSRAKAQRRGAGPANGRRRCCSPRRCSALRRNLACHRTPASFCGGGAGEPGRNRDPRARLADYCGKRGEYLITRARLRGRAARILRVVEVIGVWSPTARSHAGRSVAIRGPVWASCFGTGKGRASCSGRSCRRTRDGGRSRRLRCRPVRGLHARG